MRATDDRGETLIEVLITVVLMGIGVAGVLFGLTAGVRGSRSTQVTADGRAALVAAVEQLQATSYVPCAGVTGYNPALGVVILPQNTGGSNVAPAVTVTAISYWTTDPATNLQGFSGTDCSYDNTASASSRMQRITLMAASDEKLTIVKRAP
jgi:prepilin-type N-terminal cleavage/methylation domain-containing protein